MFCRVLSASLLGVEALPIQVEVDVAGGLPLFVTVGLAEGAVREAKVRVQSAIQNSGHLFPSGRVTVNLAPANLKKMGSAFDFPIALGVLGAQGILAPERLQKVMVFGELSLSGAIQPVHGVLAAALAAKKGGCDALLVSEGNAAEAALVRDLKVRQVKHFNDAVYYLKTGEERFAPVVQRQLPTAVHHAKDFAEVRGQTLSKRALEIAAAGGHNVLMIGGPGTGKTMMASRLPSIMPPLSEEEALEITKIHSVAGLNLGKGLMGERPFRAPHHSISRAGLVGGGSGIPRPGELSLAHRGVLFLDELPEFSRSIIENLRQPMESGEVVLSRVMATLIYPADALVVAAMNPCPCGYFGQPNQTCRCFPSEVARYRNRLSGPLLDRMDIQIEVPPVPLSLLQKKQKDEPSALIRARVLRARQRQAERYGSNQVNAQMSRSELETHTALDSDTQRWFREAGERLGLSARSHDRILRVSRTVADLADEQHVGRIHLREALQYRNFGKSGPPGG